jgi:hypothetical protein
MVRACPPAVYPEATTSPEVVYAAVVASSVAKFVYSAILNVPDVKSNVPFIMPVFNELHA